MYTSPKQAILICIFMVICTIMSPFLAGGVILGWFINELNRLTQREKSMTAGRVCTYLGVAGITTFFPGVGVIIWLSFLLVSASIYILD